MSDFLYMAYENTPCRIRTRGEVPQSAEIYKAGSGFVDGPLMTIIDNGKVLSRAEFDSLLMTHIRGNKNA